MSKPESKKTIKQKLTELDAAIEWFYGDDFALDQALEYYEQANKLAKEISDELESVKNEIEVVEDFTKS